MKFQFRPGLFAATLIGLAILCALGAWQLQRRAWKETLIAGIEAREHAPPMAIAEALDRALRGEAIEYQPVYAVGTYAHDEERHVFAVRDGRAGVYVFTPLLRDDGTPIFVNRGFAPEAAKNAAARASGQIEGVVRVEGILRAPQKLTAVEAMVRPKDQPKDNLYYARDPARFFDAPPSPRYYVESAGKENAAGVPEPAISRADLPNRHLEYALTWFGLAGALLAVYLVYSIRRS
ncbi:MAG: SURF1 family protein [Parvularculaceae bacterium]|nr:SURF1 family protein [Parvularculaceae bacterium]